MDERILKLLERAAIDSVIELKCPCCGATLRCEPDAQDSYCFECEKVVKTNNPLIKLGII